MATHQSIQDDSASDVNLVSENSEGSKETICISKACFKAYLSQINSLTNHVKTLIMRNTCLEIENKRIGKLNHTLEVKVQSAKITHQTDIAKLKLQLGRELQNCLDRQMKMEKDLKSELQKLNLLYFKESLKSNNLDKKFSQTQESLSGALANVDSLKTKLQNYKSLSIIQNQRYKILKNKVSSL